MPRTHTRAFSLVELLVVISIVAILMALVIPAVGKARDRAEQIRDLANIKQGSYHFLSYFNDNKNFMPPLAGTWGYNYGSWYNALRPYVELGNPKGTNYRQDKPYALLCQSKVVGSQTAGFPYFLYTTNWVLRYRVFGDPTTSYRLDELQHLEKTAMLFCCGSIGDAIYYSAIPYYGLTNQYSGGQLTWSAQHKGEGLNISYLDGRAEFSAIGKQLPDNYTMAMATSDVWSPDVPWVHRSFWGKTNANVWLQGNYKYND